MDNKLVELLERLRKVDNGPFPEGSMGTCWYRNPDGPEAATVIETLQAERDAALCERSK